MDVVIPFFRPIFPFVSIVVLPIVGVRLLCFCFVPFPFPSYTLISFTLPPPSSLTDRHDHIISHATLRFGGVNVLLTTENLFFLWSSHNANDKRVSRRGQEESRPPSSHT